ncbi:uncharacterized membrane protein YidH (DUF202 family) [Neomicrococcus aestuarii]|uniref:Uncharacterized membrane protein YidH (DUF202 family) n=1 Tax=Neomicrococcus aestuarii TaxID=556325 RepID=A0A7W8TTM2_9MICC|nr:hypothetical protein [Neomicrococcus aestuarii]MBB5512636.1 uncharacterized membrane protein YidH (DUF202 family) [Neomicrococcus aestuarii]
MSTSTLSLTAATPSTSERILRVVKLQLVDKKQQILVPVLITAAGIVISVIVGELIKLAGAPAGAVTEGMRNNQAALWILCGYFISLGALMYSRSLPFAVALGSTRREYWLGTTLTLLVASVGLAVASTLLLGLEKLTNGWFTGTRMYDTYIMGDGNYGYAFLMGFVISALSLLAGNFFAAIYLRWKSAGVTYSIILIVLALLGVIAADIGLQINVFGWLDENIYLHASYVSVVLMVLLSAGTWLVVRNAPIGR